VIDNVVHFPIPDPTGLDPDNVTGKYILIDRRPVPCPDLMRWGRFMQEVDRRVAFTDVDGIHVSTVFLGLDHSWTDGPPVLFETMIFGGEYDEEYQERCCTWAEAEEMHRAAVKVAKKGKKVPSAYWARRLQSKRFEKWMRRWRK
jgi:hypothetical protein